MSIRSRLLSAVRAFVSEADALEHELVVEVEAEPAKAWNEALRVKVPMWLYVSLPTTGEVYELPIPVGAEWFVQSAPLSDERRVFRCDPDPEDWS